MREVHGGEGEDEGEGEGEGDDTVQDDFFSFFGSSPRSFSTLATTRSRSSSSATASPALKQGSVVGLGVAVVEEEEEVQGRARRSSWTSRQSRKSSSSSSSGGTTMTMGTGTGTGTGMAKVVPVEEGDVPRWYPVGGDTVQGKLASNQAIKVDAGMVAELMMLGRTSPSSPDAMMVEEHNSTHPTPSTSHPALRHQPRTSSLSSFRSPKSSSSTTSLSPSHRQPATSVSSSSSSTPTLNPPSAKDKPARRAYELGLGERILRAAGASEREVQMRARAVGWRVCREVEEGAREGKQGEPRGEGEKERVGRYVGGEGLESKFSWT